MKDNPKNMPAIDTGSRFSAHPIATNTQMEGIRQMSSFHILLLIKQGAALLKRNKLLVVLVSRMQDACHIEMLPELREGFQFADRFLAS